MRNKNKGEKIEIEPIQKEVSRKKKETKHKERYRKIRKIISKIEKSKKWEKI